MLRTSFQPHKNIVSAPWKQCFEAIRTLLVINDITTKERKIPFTKTSYTLAVMQGLRPSFLLQCRLAPKQAATEEETTSFLRLASQQGKPWKQAGAVLGVKRSHNFMRPCAILRPFFFSNLNNTERASYYYVVIQPINLVFQIKLCNFA